MSNNNDQLRRNWVQRVLFEQQKYRTEANVDVILHVLQNEVTITEQTIRDIIRQNEHRLVLNKDYDDAFTQFFAIYPGLCVESNVNIMTRELQKRGQEITTQALIQLVKNDGGVWATQALTASRAWRDEQQRKRETKAQQEAEYIAFEKEQEEAEQLTQILLRKYFRKEEPESFVRGFDIPRRYEIEKAELAKKSVAELRALVQAQRYPFAEQSHDSIKPTPLTLPGFQPLPSTYIYNGPDYRLESGTRQLIKDGQEFQWTRNLIVRVLLPSELKILLHRHGNEAIENAVSANRAKGII